MFTWPVETFRNHASRFGGCESGAIAVVFAICLLVMCAAAGVGLDSVRASRAQKDMQTALDGAVLAAIKAPAKERASVGESNFLANFSVEVENLSVNIHSSGADEVAGTVTGNVPTTLAGVLGIDSLPVSATAVSVKGEGTSTTTTTTSTSSEKVCILILDPSASQSFLVNSGAYLDASSCEIHVRSTGSPAAIYNASSTIKSVKTCIKGTNIIDNGGTHPNVGTGCNAASDPFAGTLAEPSSASCTYSNLNYNGGTVNLTPGVYCGWINFNNAPTVNFAPGTYVIKGGGWNVNAGTWKGTDVTFFFADTSKIQFNTGIKSQLSAPVSGPYKNVLMFEKAGLTKSQFVWNDTQGAKLDGLLYLPSRNVIFNSSSTTAGDVRLTMVFNTLILDDTDIKLESSGKVINGTSTTVSTSTTTTTDGGVYIKE